VGYVVSPLPRRPASHSAWPTQFLIDCAGAFEFCGLCEFVAGTTGLGQVILVSQSSFQIGRMFVAIVILGILGTMLFYAVDFAERLLIPWHVSQRGGRMMAPA